MMPFGRVGRGLDGLERWREGGVGMWREQPYNMIHMLIAFSGHSHSPFGDGGRATNSKPPAHTNELQRRELCDFS